MTQAISEIDVLIVGAGPTGLTLACELQRRGIRYRLIDRRSRAATTSRAVALHSRTLEIFSSIGITEPIVARSIHIIGVTVYQRERFLMVLKLLHALDTPYPFVLILPQKETEQILSEHLASVGGKVEFSRELVSFRQKEGAMIALVNDESGAREEIRARWLIGCDGSHSRVRSVLNIPFAGQTLIEEFLLADVDLDWTLLQRTTHVWLHQGGLFAALPLPDQRQWRLFATITTPLDQCAPLASIELFQKLLQERTGDMKTTISNPTWLSNFRVSERLVTHYRQGYTFLVGDAAHIHSPFGGQGMNIGIQDAYNLAWKLALVLQGRAPESLLDTYEQERRPVAQRIVKDTHILTGILISQNMLWRFIRDQIVVRLFRLSWIQRLLARQGSELNIAYRASKLTRRAFSLRRGLKPGDRVPQAYFRLGSSGAEASLFGLLRAPTSLLLLFAGTQSATDHSYLASVARSVEEHLDDVVRVYIVLSGSEKPAGLPWHGEILLDYQNNLYQLCGARKEKMCFIRPDGYIGLNERLDKKVLWTYLNHIFS